MNGYSQAPQKEWIKTLQSLMPEIFDEGRIDWGKLKATLGEEVDAWTWRSNTEVEHNQETS